VLSFRYRRIPPTISSRTPHGLLTCPPRNQTCPPRYPHPTAKTSASCPRPRVRTNRMSALRPSRRARRDPAGFLLLLRRPGRRESRANRPTTTRPHAPRTRTGTSRFPAGLPRGAVRTSRPSAARAASRPKSLPERTGRLRRVGRGGGRGSAITSRGRRTKTRRGMGGSLRMGRGGLWIRRRVGCLSIMLRTLDHSRQYMARFWSWPRFYWTGIPRFSYCRSAF
jgi:hypothetical protein